MSLITSAQLGQFVAESNATGMSIAFASAISASGTRWSHPARIPAARASGLVARVPSELFDAPTGKPAKRGCSAAVQVIPDTALISATNSPRVSADAATLNAAPAKRTDITVRYL